MSEFNILVIEDDKILNQQLTELLTSKNYQCVNFLNKSNFNCSGNVEYLNSE